MEATPTKSNHLGAYIIAVTILFGLAFAVSCRKSGSHSSMGAMHPSPQASAPNGVAVKTYHGVGLVKDIGPKNKVITINHEEIKGYMPAMSMEYHPRDRTLLDAVKSGDHIEFTLEDVAGDYHRNQKALALTHEAYLQLASLPYCRSFSSCRPGGFAL